MEEGPKGRRGEVGTGDASSGRSRPGRVHPASRLGRTPARPLSPYQDRSRPGYAPDVRTRRCVFQA